MQFPVFSFLVTTFTFTVFCTTFRFPFCGAYICKFRNVVRKCSLDNVSFFVSLRYFIFLLLLFLRHESSKEKFRSRLDSGSMPSGCQWWVIL